MIIFFTIIILLLLIICFQLKNGQTKFIINKSATALVNVKADFGAAGDGIKDDTVAIQQAINSVDKGIIYFPGGVYLVGELKLKNDVTLTSFNDALQYTGNEGPVILKATSNSVVIINTEKVSGYAVSGITFDGNHKKESGMSGGSYNGLIKNCKFYNCDVGIGKNLKNEYSGFLFTTNIEGCYFDSCNNGIANVIDSKITNNFIYSCDIGIMLTGSDNTITGNKIEWNDRYGIAAYAAGHCVISNNIIDRSGFDGLFFNSDSEGNSVTGNVFRRNGALGEKNNEKAHILVEGSSNIVFNGNVTVAENSKDDKTGKVVPDFSIYCENSKYVSITGNNLIGALKEQIIQSNNQGFKVDSQYK